MVKQQTPLEVMFSLFKASFGLSHRALAELILSDRPLTNGRPTAQMAQDTSWLSRTVVHSQPGSLEDRYFADWSCASRRILHELRERGHSGGDIHVAIVLATDAMVRALAACVRNGLLYRNAISRLARRQPDEDDRALISIALIVSTACWCDPARTIAYTMGSFDCAKDAEALTPPQTFHHAGMI